MQPHRPVSPEQLLSHAGWVRSLARGLLRDPQAAEDVVQATWVAALERGPQEGRPLAAWLGRVARNFARKRMRSEARRGAHETLAARAPDRAEGEPSAAELYERAAFHRELVEAVMGLDEPYRSTILLRYFEDLPPRAIARREGIPVQTVKTRIARALEKLRARLDTRSGGDRTAWIGALAAFTRKPFAVGAGTTAITIMSTNLKLVGAGALLASLAATLFVWRTRSAEEAPRLVRSSPALAADSAQSPLERSDLAPASSTEPARKAESHAAVPNSTTAIEEALDPDLDLHGRVTDSSGQPLRGARIEIRSCEVRGFDLMSREPGLGADVRVSATASNERGEFRVRLPRARPFDLVAKLSGYAERKMPSRYAGEDVQVVLTAGCTLFGRVTRKSDGAPCAGAVVHVVQGIIRSSGEAEYRAEADESGAYRLEGLPADGLEIDVESRDAVAAWGIVVQGREGAAIERDVALESGLVVRGVVTDATTGLPIAGAEIRAGRVQSPMNVRTDPDGRYALKGLRIQSGLHESLSASAPGFATVQRNFGVSSADPLEIDFQLRPGRAAKGRVLGPDDRPVVGALVTASSRGSFEDGHFSERLVVRTSADGTFELTHLADRAHHTLFLRKEGCGTKVFEFPLDEESRASIDFGDLRLPESATIFGRVVDENGKPVPDTYVGIEGANSDALRFSDPERGGVHLFDTHRTGRTDDRGRFGFCDLSPGTYSIRVSGVKGSATSTVRAVVVGEGESSDELVFVLRLGLLLEGRVVDPAGNPVPGMMVLISRERTPKEEARFGEANDFSRADGSFHLQGLEEGTYAVIVETFLPAAENGARDLANKSWTGVPAGSRDLVLVLPAAAWIEGVVSDSNGAPAIGAQVQANGVEDESSDVFLPTSTAQTDVDGHFRVKVCASSRVNIRAFSYASTASNEWEPQGMAEAKNVAAGATDVKLKLAPWR